MIVRIGGDGWSLGIHEAILKLISSQLRFTITIDGNALHVGIRGAGYESYLVLEPDGFPLHNLNFPSC